LIGFVQGEEAFIATLSNQFPEWLIEQVTPLLDSQPCNASSSAFSFLASQEPELDCSAITLRVSTALRQTACKKRK